MSACRTIRYFSLLFVERIVGKHANLTTRHRDPIDIYIECASTLALSLRASQSTLAVLTNDKAFVTQRIKFLGLPDVFEVHEFSFSRSVPQGIPFYSAHFKLDLFRFFGANKNPDPICLLDGDTVLLRPLQIERPSDEQLFVYNIVSQLSQDRSSEKLASDIRLVGGKTTNPVSWYGGEFILGCPSAFNRLADKVDEIWPNYLKHIPDVHHVGDEMVVTAALGLLQAEGMKLIDIAETKLIGRWWTARTNSVQVRFTVAAASNIIHLPSDKVFLSQQCRKTPFSTQEFLLEYQQYARQKLLRRRLTNPFLNAIRGTKKFVGRI
ncbi:MULTISPECIES: hypothetical protein [unclassified Bradyrhizobium]|uniref:hypothetical protein n=1 Tax=unclassified Bradyrhizobium TaxID=2631580 RepID=UPI001FFAE739|nr:MULTISPECIES: hypothetical protein [unclassified Bradyrhizobium]MCK1518869.1 hypothetical protein [Bradyrhizobium sp. 17]MCK1684603.1 hypothetical protein [Bradyrhizobium sp. 145]